MCAIDLLSHKIEVLAYSLIDLRDSMAERSSNGEVDISAGSGSEMNLASSGTGFSREGAGRPRNLSARERRSYRVISMNIGPVGCINP